MLFTLNWVKFPLLLASHNPLALLYCKNCPFVTPLIATLCNSSSSKPFCIFTSIMPWLWWVLITVATATIWYGAYGFAVVNVPATNGLSHKVVPFIFPCGAVGLNWSVFTNPKRPATTTFPELILSIASAVTA